jgi:hypothetical protein
MYWMQLIVVLKFLQPKNNYKYITDDESSGDVGDGNDSCP